ncbi:MAG: hypothetical protein AAFU61_18585, partial [Pseudomonadota bacterium]
MRDLRESFELAATSAAPSRRRPRRRPSFLPPERDPRRSGTTGGSEEAKDGRGQDKEEEEQAAQAAEGIDGMAREAAAVAGSGSGPSQAPGSEQPRWRRAAALLSHLRPAALLAGGAGAQCLASAMGGSEASWVTLLLAYLAQNSSIAHEELIHRES